MPIFNLKTITMNPLRMIMICATLVTALASAHAQQISYSVEKIWDNGMHNAFTSIEEFKGEYYVTFREGESHIFDSKGNAEGKIRILHSKNGKKWEALPAIGKEGYDLRDPKFSVTPDGRLMVIIGGSIYRNKVLVGSQPHVMFSSDGRTFTDPQPVNVDERYRTERDWLWRVTWHNGVGYSISYGRTEKGQTPLYLYSTTDGINYKHITSFEIENFPNEATIRFLEDGRMAIMLRREQGDRECMWGVSRNAEFTEWEWKKMGTFLGGPDFIVLDDEHIVAGGRTFLTSAAKTSLLVGNKDGKFEQVVVLPSGGDTSYPGFVVAGDELWVSYYSMHDSKNASIHLAKIPLELFGVEK